MFVLLTALLLAAALPQSAPSASDVRDRILAALPKSDDAPATPRKLLVCTRTMGYRHESIPVGVLALTLLGEKSGAFSVTHTEDLDLFESDALARFDAVCFLNATGEVYRERNLDKLPAERQAAARQREKRLQENLVAFVAAGKGLVGIHSATDCCYEWPAYGELIGGYFDGHPWHERVTLINEEPAHPLCKPFGPSIEIADEIYQIRDPYSRTRQRVLLSLDTQRTDMKKDGIKRADRDFPVSWIRTHEKGRVFYCSLGHRDEIYWNPQVLEHYLAGIRFALGDLPADATPRSAPAASAPSRTP
jgi:uncharacterized protein